MMRYALYYAPDAASALWHFGSEVLGYDAASGRAVDQWRPDGFLPEEWFAATADPRLYGFHATLKAPFVLREDRSEAELTASLKQFAARARPVMLGHAGIHAVPSAIGGAFIAVTPAAAPAALADLEHGLVEGFESFRAPMTAEDRLRRRPDRLSERQRNYLDHYGYPFVFEEFRFHMTLTGRLDRPEPVIAALEERAGAIVSTLCLDRVALFRQDGPGERFSIAVSFDLAG